MATDTDRQTAEREGDILSRRAEVFRSKLIHKFHLLESLGEEGFDATSRPYMFTRDVLEEKRCRSMMMKEPFSLIQFQLYSKSNKTKLRRQLTAEERRLNLVRNKNSRVPSFDVIAQWIVNSRWFNVIVIIALFVNAFVVGVDVELYQWAPDRYPTAQSVIDIISVTALGIFALEIFLKLVDHFWMFWTSNWNMYDLVVTVFSLSAEIIKLCSTSAKFEWLHQVARQLTSMRILCSVKLIIYFSPVRILLVTITRAGKELLLYSTVIIIIAYIYAVLGTAAFDYTTIQETGERIQFPHSVDTVFHSLQTILQIATNDHWIQLIRELRMTNAGVFSYFYVISWLFVGNYLLINLITGSLVSYYTGVRVEMTRASQHIDAENQLNELVDKLDEEAVQHEKKMSEFDLRQPSYVTQASQESVMPALQSQSMNDWQTTVERNLSNLAMDESTFYWASDTLFYYYMAMEALQENLEERKQLLHMMTQTLLDMNDT